jgi:hypothetical protein
LYAAALPAGAASCADISDACTLTTAVADATAGATIELVTPGPKATTTVNNVTVPDCAASPGACYNGNFTVASIGVMIEPAPGVSNPVLDGDNTGTVLSVNSSYVTLSGVTITGGNAGYGYGGGVYDGGTLTVTDSTVVGNYAGYGAGIYSNGSVLTLADSTVADNATFSGGTGGGLDSDAGTLTVTDSTIADNTAATGGGVYNAGYGVGGTLAVTASTVAGNTATSGAGIYNYGQGTVFLAADILAAAGGAPGGGECAGSPVVDSGFNVADDSSCGLSQPSSFQASTPGQVSAVEALGGLADNGGPTETILPGAGNPAIGRIPPDSSVSVNGAPVGLCPATDQRGVASTPGASCDAGSVQTAGVSAAGNAPTASSAAGSGNSATNLNECEAGDAVDYASGYLNQSYTTFRFPDAGRAFRCRGPTTLWTLGSRRSSGTAGRARCATAFQWRRGR